MATTITAGNATNGAAISSDNTGILELKSGTGSGTTAMTVGTGQNVTFAQAANLPNTFGFKNRIINGAMVIDQRNNGASVTPINAAYVLDRYVNNLTQASKFSVQQSTTAPAGFSNSMLVTSLSAYSITSTDNFQFEQRVEGFNFADMAWGTASASAITLSFWVRSSLTGTFGGSLRNNAGDRSYPFSYTISAANTWEQKTVTIAGDTTGTWVGGTNGIAVRVGFSLGTGSTLSGAAGSWAAANYLSATGATSVVGTNGATFYITGVQLEKGSTATSFDVRPYGTELALCQRYYYKTSPGALDRVLANGYNNSATGVRAVTPFMVPMRTSPTALEQNGTAGDYSALPVGGEIVCSAVPTYAAASQEQAWTNFTVASGLTAGQGVFAVTNSTTAFLAWSAEL
jgi:hypothetical protein